MTNANPEPARGLAGEPLTPAARQRLFATLHAELEHATAEALSQGVPAEFLVTQIDEVIALLRGQLNDPDQTR